MTELSELETALRSPQPEQSLRQVVDQLAAKGLSKPLIYEMLESLLLQVRGSANGMASCQDAVLNVMDSLEGWCHSGARLPG